MGREGEALHSWSLAMAVVGLLALALWLWAPALLSPVAMSAAVALWALLGFGVLFVRIGGYRRWADRVTAVRVLLCIALFASCALDPQPGWSKVGISTLILVLDGVDGALARHFGPTERGAVFDMESDAFYTLISAAVAYLYLEVTVWVLLIGALRPLYVCGWAVLERFFPQRSPNAKGSPWARIIFLIVAITLIANLASIVPLPVKQVLSIASAVLLSLSFLQHLLASIDRSAPV
ncbi:CDP-alcohol phosphatidyltransferase family protein [Haliangium ochraceum]|uniref:CDP-alcohol phosphatidyltransferase n=1 Tax=Haliangium ochraceum (strain DSM 14365 / JCM 11303 / SMP-2) TaxID=502025 RepID=D0LLG4_HALO1|nr:CDP-alcohol phosphatidyltransferase family protein [Haliangium ochraceum]ACY13181.1 CDP-alcohol phosphatidyltransferase [Haliangium ochraceum DSM 14365]